MYVAKTVRQVSYSEWLGSRLLIRDEIGLQEAALEKRVKQIDFRFGFVVRIGIGVGFEVVRVRVDNDSPVTRLVLVHKDRTAGHDQAE